MRLGRRGEQISSHRVVDVDGGFAYGQREGGDVLVELLREVRVENGVKDSDRGLVGHVGEAEEVEVPEHPIAHRVATTARRAHATHDDHVLQRPERARGMALVPAAVVHPLPQKFDGRLGEILLAHRHVKIVDEDGVLLTHRRPEHALAPLVHLRVEEVLRLISRRARAERHEHRDVQVRHVVVELVHDVQGLAGAGVANAEHVLVVQEQLVDDIRVPHRVRRGHDDGSESLVRIGLVLGNGLHPLDPLALVLVVAVLVHARVALALGRHEIGEFVLLGFLTEKLLQLRPAGTRDGRAEGPNHREDPEGNRGFVRVPPLFAAERLLALHRVPHVPLEQRGHQVELPLHQARVHRGHSLLQVLSHEEHDALHAGHDRVEDLAELVDVRLEQIGQRLQVGVEQRRETHRGRLHVNHAASRNRRRGRHRQVLNLEHHRHRRAHLNDLARDEAQLLVIVQHGVHVLDPDGVHGAVEHEPLLVQRLLLGQIAHVTREHAILPLVRRGVEIAVQLAHGDRLGVQNHVLDLLVSVRASLREPGHRGRQRAVVHRLTAAGWTHEHQPVTNQGHLVHLNHLVDERGHGLDPEIGAGLIERRHQVLVVRLGLGRTGEQIADDALEQRKIVGQKFGHVDVHQPAEEQNLLVVLGEIALEVTRRGDDGLHGAHAVVVVVLRGELFGAELKRRDHLPRQRPSVFEAKGHQRNLADERVIGNHHRAGAEQSLEVIGELGAPGVARVHRDKNAAPRVEVELGVFEYEPLLLLLDGNLNRQNLLRDDREHLEVDSVELVEARPRAG